MVDAKKFRYKFKNKDLFDLAMTQSGANQTTNNERLEFLGDRVLGLSVAELLYDMFPDEPEGDLARRHSVLVSSKTLAKIAAGFGFDKTVRHGHMTAGRMENVLSDAMEAVLGAMYLDGGWRAAHKFVTDAWSDLARAEITAPKDPKSRLQELAQRGTSGDLPVYEYSAKRGEFKVRVTALGQSAEGRGSSKKAASINAAEQLLAQLNG